MIASDAFRGRRYAVLGLARSGMAAVQALLASGAGVTAWDADEAKRDHLFSRPSLAIADPLATDLAGFDGVVVSPGVPLNRHPIAARARAANVPVIGDIELFALARPGLPPHRVVGVTGTNGKSTTTALIHHILTTAGVPATMGGNIGLPILGQEPLPEGGVYVLELSSYQLDLTFSLDCDVAVLTNITPDHLDRYDGFEAYAASKARLFGMSTGMAVIATEDDASRRVASHLRHPGLVPGPTQPPAAPRAMEWTSEQVRGDVVEVSSASIADPSAWPALQGPHNAQNAACAIATCRVLGLSEDQIAHGLRTYPGLPHRMERVAEKAGVLYVNDSKATNATAAAPALAAYPVIHWILGGRPKSDELDDCRPHFAHVKAAYTIGEAGPMFANILRSVDKPVTESGTLAQAVRDAAAVAQPGETVMLSPACASFDQFTDYEARGQAFRDAVAAL